MRDDPTFLFVLRSGGEALSKGISSVAYRLIVRHRGCEILLLGKLRVCGERMGDFWNAPRCREINGPGDRREFLEDLFGLPTFVRDIALLSSTA